MSVRRLALAVFLSLIAAGVSAQSILTVAGGGSDDGKLATDIALNGPRGLTLDGNGSLYVAERFQGLVRRINIATGIVETVAGIGAAGYGGDNGPAKKATLKEPRGLFYDQNGDLYIADDGNGRVRKIDGKTGIITTVAGRGKERADATLGDNGPATDAVLRGPWGLWIDRGNLYITEDGYQGLRLRKVVLSTGIITTIAGPVDGSEGFLGDGGPALLAKFRDVQGIIIDSAGNIFLADSANDRVRRIDAATGNIDTYAGGGAPATGTGDGGPATAAKLNYPTTMAFDPAGNLLMLTADGVRRVDKSTRIISTVVPDTGLGYGVAADAAGNIFVSSDGYRAVLRIAAGSSTFTFFAGGGSYVGDGLAATAALLRDPQGMAVDASGNLFIADASDLLVRRIDAATGVISTVAGNGYYSDNGVDGKPATASEMYPVDIAFDRNGDLYIADNGNLRIKKVDAKTGIVTFYAGSGQSPDATTNNEGVPALQAKFSDPVGVSFDSAGNLYVADGYGGNRVWKVDAVTKTVSAFAGNGKQDYAGDGGPATAAGVGWPAKVVFDASGNAYIAEYFNDRIRMVTPAGTISTYAGGGAQNPPFGDGGPASQAFLTPGHMAIDAARGRLFVADTSASRLRQIDLQTSTISTIAGSGTFYYVDADFTGDNGPAKDAKLNLSFDISGVSVDAAGNLAIADALNNRVRAVFACTDLIAPQLTAVADGTAAPRLAWSAVRGAFRYELLLDTATTPARVIASDLTETSFSPANLQPGTKYYWSVVAKGDPFCPVVSTAASAISSFTTAAGCASGSFDLAAPADGAQNVDAASLRLSWQAAPGAGTYDVYYGPTNPPPLVAGGISQTSYAPAPIASAFWFVVAHASCDPAKTSSTGIRSFTTNLSGGCAGTPGVSVAAPATGAIDVAASVELQWSVGGAGAIDTFDVYFGTASDPPLLRGNVAGNARSISLSQLAAGTTYYWRVVGHSPCIAGGSASTPVASFTTHADCTVPGATSILFAPASVPAGATYTIVWSAAPGLDAGGGYFVERSNSASFSSVLDSQVSSSTAASFVAGSAGTYYHRVRALPECDPTKSGPVSPVAGVNVVGAPANIIFTVQPLAVVTSLGEKIEDRRGSFTLENIGAAPAQIIVGQSELPGSRPFFSIAEGGAFITLQPRVPRTFTIQYSGPPNNTAGSYQGVIFAVGVTQSLPVTPYSFVNLKVGGGPAVAPQFVIDGTPGEYAAFDGFSGDDDSNRGPRQISIHNPGPAPMELAAEVGPEVWLVPENGWNSQPLAAGATRTVNLFTRRPFAPSGSPLPRYTYFTVRTKDGASARLLVQDNDRVPVGGGRSTALEVGARSFIVPDVTTQLQAGGRAVTRLRLSNSGGDSVQVSLIYTPRDKDGFGPNAIKSAIVVPANDVVTLTDPLKLIFGASDGASGQIEVRIPRERLGLIAVTASTITLGAGTTAIIPVVARREGARIGAPHVIDLATPAATTLTLAETSGADQASVRVVASGQTLTRVIPRYGMTRVSVGSPSRIEIDVDSGGGSVVGLATAGNATFASRPLNDFLAARLGKGAFAGVVSVTTVVPVISGVSSAGAAPSLNTAIGLLAQSAAATFTMTFYPGSGGVALNRSVSVPAGQTTVYNDVMRDLFAVSNPADGNLFVQGPPTGKVYAVLQAAVAGSASTPSSAVPLPTTLSEALTSAAGASQRPLAFDGLEQSVDPSRGSRWLLLLNEMGGGSGFVNVRLYEAGNRSRPIAEKDLTIGANQQVKLDTVFGALGLDASDRRKDRTNVEVVVTASAGTARVAASAVSVDNRTGDTKMIPLMPAIGSGNPNVSFVTPVVNAPPPVRRRAAPH